MAEMNENEFLIEAERVKNGRLAIRYITIASTLIMFTIVAALAQCSLRESVAVSPGWCQDMCEHRVQSMTREQCTCQTCESECKGRVSTSNKKECVCQP